VRIALVVETADGLQLVRPFDRQRAIAAIVNGNRPDTAQVRILVKTAVVDADAALSDPFQRLDAFRQGREARRPRPARSRGSPRSAW
jgi:hypothetical protein